MCLRDEERKKGREEERRVDPKGRDHPSGGFESGRNDRPAEAR